MAKTFLFIVGIIAVSLLTIENIDIIYKNDPTGSILEMEQSMFNFSKAENYNAINLSLVLQTYLRNKDGSMASSLVVAVANAAHVGLVMNWYASFASLRNASKYAIVSLDWKLYKYLNQKNIFCLHVFHLLNKTDIPSTIESEQQWGGALYDKLTVLKIKVVLSLLKTYRIPVIFSDVDVVWLHSSIQKYLLFQMKRYNYEIMFSDDRPGMYPCTGLYLIMPNSFGIRHLEKVIAVAEKRKINDQLATIDVIEGYTNVADMKKIGFLDWLLFQNGYTINNGLHDEYRVRGWTIHANFVIGLREKINLLKRNKAWFINETDIVKELSLIQ